MNILIDGLPIEAKIKRAGVFIILLLIVINHNMPMIHSVLDYNYRNIISLILIILFVVISIGSKFAEMVVIGAALFAIISSSWDFSVYDLSEFRRKVWIGSWVVLIAAVTFGKISLAHVAKILTGQFGVDRK